MLPMPSLGRLKRGVALSMLSWTLSLVLGPALATANSAADYYVQSLPGAPDGPLLKMHAG